MQEVIKKVAFDKSKQEKKKGKFIQYNKQVKYPVFINSDYYRHIRDIDKEEEETSRIISQKTQNNTLEDNNLEDFDSPFEMYQHVQPLYKNSAKIQKIAQNNNV